LGGGFEVGQLLLELSLVLILYALGGGFECGLIFNNELLDSRRSFNRLISQSFEFRVCQS
jgi:hypothetical protein